MNILTWIIFFCMIVGCSFFGIYIYSKPYLREKVNLRQVWELFWIFNFLKIFDILSTVYFTSRLGIEYEGNLLVRELMNVFGIWGGLGVASLLFIPYSFFLFLSINYVSNVSNNGIIWKIFKILIITVGIIVPLINIGSIPI